ncbi:MAG: heparan-alpha-glucosaminide N-acetyltransferase domain-containing protein [Oscillospiraceae bacterium]|nr:heparan-alpha-glucosaminide N-acetyltransferase domain-containing protein [Oscillospiraceae bacterium]
MVKQRDLAIDRFRGLTIILMVIVNDLANVEDVPAILHHAPRDGGIGLADLVSKFFIFAIAATYAMSFNKRAAVNRKDAYFHFFHRYLAIMGLGALFGVFNAAWTGDTNWGTLHTIGLAGLLTLIVIRFPWWVRVASGMFVLGVYQLTYHFARDIFVGEIGAVFEGVSMTAALMLSTAMIDLFRKGIKPFLIGTGVLSLAAFGPLLLPGIYITKHNQVTFILICVSISCAVYLAADLLSKKVLPKRPGLVSWWGENPMLFYVIHLMLTGAAMAIDPRPLWLGIPINLAILSVMSLIAWQTHRKDIKISF